MVLELENQALPVDFTDLPVEEAITLLQEIGLLLLRATLQRERPQLYNFFTTQQANLLVRLRIESGAHTHFGQIIKTAVHSQTPISEWRRQVIVEIKHQLGVLTENRLPPDFWHLISYRAWCDPTFKRTVSDLIETELRQRTFFALGEFKTMILSPHTFWLLIALTDIYLPAELPEEKKGWLRRLWEKFQRLLLKGYRFRVATVIRPEKSHIVRAIRLLRSEGEKHGLSTSWATVWDQWILLEAWKRWQSQECSQELKQTMYSLPLNKYDYQLPEFEQDSSKKPKTEAVSIAKSNWEDDVPTWFQAWSQVLEKDKQEGL